jgi:hypothetical protein
MAAATKPGEYTVEIRGPAATGTYDGEVKHSGHTIGWTTQYGSPKAAHQAAGAIVERHQAGARVLEVDPAAIRAEIEAEQRPKPRELTAVERPMTQADVNAYERERKAHNAGIREDNEKRMDEGLKRISRERNEANQRAREARRRTAA